MVQKEAEMQAGQGLPLPVSAPHKLLDESPLVGLLALLISPS